MLVWRIIFEEVFLGTCSLLYCGLAIYQVRTANHWMIFPIFLGSHQIGWEGFSEFEKNIVEICVTSNLSSLLLLSVCFMTASCSVSQAGLELLILLCVPKSGLLVLSACTTTPSSPFSHKHPLLDHISLPVCHPTLFLHLRLFACLSDCAPCAYSTLRGLSDLLEIEF